MEASDGAQVSPPYLSAISGRICSDAKADADEQVALWLSRVRPFLMIRDMLMGQDTHIEDTYVEIIGSVKEDGSVKALTNINLGNSLGESLHICSHVSRGAANCCFLEQARPAWLMQ